jgi:hypothetical protein
MGHLRAKGWTTLHGSEWRSAEKLIEHGLAERVVTSEKPRQRGWRPMQYFSASIKVTEKGRRWLKECK